MGFFKKKKKTFLESEWSTPAISFYKFRGKVGVVEIFVQDEFKTIKRKLDNFTIKDEKASQDSWQVIYMEQYFNADRTIKLCETYDEPLDKIKDFNLVFFIYELRKGQILYTPFGTVIVTELKELPDEYKKRLEFESMN